MLPADARYDALVLAGGAGRRLGGLDKPALQVGGRRLLDRVLDAVRDAERVVVVGPARDGLPAGVRTVCEQPPGGGPVAAIAAGLTEVRAPAVAVLAADLPFLTAAAVAGLRAALAGGRAGAVLLDDTGRPQLLAGAWRTDALRAAVAALPAVAGASVRRLVGDLDPVGVEMTGEPRPPWWDCDTVDDLRRAEELA